MLKSALYIVPTPIGNLEDITLRAVRVLKEATLIAAEDTRHSKLLLDHLGVSGAKLVSCYDQVEEQKAALIIDEVRRGGSVALISDAGSPLINDPGYRVVRQCALSGVKVVPLPGPCALITALEAAALPTDRFEFRGFFPVKDKELRDTVKELENARGTTVFYETPRRILATCEVLAELLPEHPVALCREMTKAFESFYRMQAKELPAFLKADPDRCRGEFAVAVGAAESRADTGIPEAVRTAAEELLSNNSAKTVSQVLSDLTGLRRKELYALACALKDARGA
ncbi:MAG: 16S rRNA (cytidine(1402)-2'-O)-methyltransferase [Succinivibrio sp.]|jgi:16S rRNA (cytidine1402-2'-O)-methyltransferase|nr:16S rRNA (cytidine(1402)-2'-O)-methyltransferase [Succinivibrio sp.]